MTGDLFDRAAADIARRLTLATVALDRIADAAGQDTSEDPLQVIRELSADALAELHDPATGKPWD